MVLYNRIEGNGFGQTSYVELPIIPTSHERNWIEWPFHASVTGVETVGAQVWPPAKPIAEYDGKELATE